MYNGGVCETFGLELKAAYHLTENPRAYQEADNDYRYKKCYSLFTQPAIEPIKAALRSAGALASSAGGKVTDGARFDRRMLRHVVTNDNTASYVWADTAYRSRSNEAWLRSIGRVSRVHRKKPKGKPLPPRTARANAAKSTVRARIEHVFARQKDQMGNCSRGWL